MKVTSRLLKSKGACESQVELFAGLYPKGVAVTEAVCVAVFDKFDWNWAALNLLSEAASAEYERVGAAAWAEYGRVTAPAWAEYERVTASAFGRLASQV